MAVLAVRAVLRDDGDDGDDAPRDREVTEATGDEPTTTTESTVEGVADADALDAAVLRLADLPSGWVEASEASGIELCPEADPLREVPPTASRAVAFTGGASGPFLASTVAAYRDEGRAEDLMEAAADSIETCDRYEVDGATYALERFTVRGLGEESLAARVEGENAVGDVGGSVHYVRSGRHVVVVASLGVGGTADDAVARAALEAVLARL